jgi:predicted Zn finger-like uncharacterized protein
MNDANPVEIMETSCPHCQSRFRVSEQQIQLAMGQVQCGECGKIFDAWESLKYEDDDQHESSDKIGTTSEQRPVLSLHEAMYGDRRNRLSQFAPLFWLVGILLLVAISIAQVIYYQRFSLIEIARYQKQVLSLCQLVPCNESRFSSTQQIKLLDRNVFTHPVQSSALMVTGSFVNQAIFDQRLPKLLVSLFDLQGKLIANRLFNPGEYLQTDKNRRLMEVAKPVQFRLEISDPGTDALTYEFEFM